MRQALLAFGLAIFGCVSNGHAESPTVALGNTHVQLSTRVFDIGQTPRDYYAEEGFLPLDRVRWLQPLIAEEPLFEGGVFHIDRHPSHSAEFLWKDPTRFGRRVLTEDPPPEFAHPRYDHSVRLNLPQNHVILTPKSEEPDHAVSCTKDTVSQTLRFCALLVSYPPDPRLYLKMRIYGHGPVPDRKHSYADMAQRMREIVYCLDVTNDVDPDGPSRFEGKNFDDMEAFLAFCREDLVL